MHSNNSKTATNNLKTIVITSLISVASVIIITAIINSGKAGEQSQQALESAQDLIGKPIPNIQLTDKNGDAYSVADLKGKNVVLFFSEGIMCYPACWNQVSAFGTDARFNSADTVAFSVVIDAPQDWQRAMVRMPDLAKATMLFDRGAVESRKLKLLSMASSMHAGQLPGHTYILLDKQGVVRDVIDDPNMAVANDAIMRKILAF